MKGLLGFVILIAVFVGIIFLLQSDYFKGIGIEKFSFRALTSTQTQNGSSSAKSKVSGSVGGGKGATSTSPRASSTSKISSKATSTINPKDIPEGFTISQLSPYFHKVRLGTLSPGSSRSYGKISLSSKLLEGESVNITGWVIKGKRGSQTIPKAVNLYEPLGLTPETDIIFGKGHLVNIYSSESAIGRNLRLNKCIGYLENTSRFTPALPRSCPRADRSEIQDFSSRCQDYISSLSSCAWPKSNILLPINDYACRAYLDKINYRGCFEKYQGDKDFLGKEWRVWTGSRFLDERHDKVQLFDRNGLLVDQKSY
jgi:hypothetical protein